MSDIIYFALTQDVSNIKQTNLDGRWGFGDVLRGVNNLHSVCQDLELELKLLSNNHPLGQILNMCDDEIDDLDPRSLKFINFETREEMCDHVLQLRSSTEKPIIFTNGFGVWDTKYAMEFNEFIKPKIKFQKQSNETTLAIKRKIGNYDILHVRLGDEALFENSYVIPKQLINFIDRIKKPTILISDCESFKDLYRASTLIHVSKNVAVHTGVTNSKEKLIETINDFKLMMGAENIYTYSIYSWVSGFAIAASEINKVNIYNIKKVSIFTKVKRRIKKVFSLWQK
jgi:hypothetical protein